MNTRPDVIMIRHGHSVGNAGHTTHNFAEIALTETGRTQANRVSREITEHFGAQAIAHIIVTPYLRTHQTASPLLAETGIKPLVWPDLREITYLQPLRADGTTYDGRATMRKEFWDATKVNPEYKDDGEYPVDSANSFLRRIHRTLGNLADLAAQGDGIVIAYAHEFPISAAVSIASGTSDHAIIADMTERMKPNPPIDNTQAIGLHLDNGRLTLATPEDVDLFPGSRLS